MRLSTNNECMRFNYAGCNLSKWMVRSTRPGRSRAWAAGIRLTSFVVMINTRPSLQVTPSSAFSSALSEILLLLSLPLSLLAVLFLIEQVMLPSLFYLHVFDIVDITSSSVADANALCNYFVFAPYVTSLLVLILLLLLLLYWLSVSLMAFSISSMSNSERGGKVLTIVSSVSSSMSCVWSGKTYTDKCNAPAMASAKLVLPVPGAPWNR